jgi:tRNA(Ile)-lysidine synthase
MDLRRRVLRTVRRHELFGSGDAIAIAVSAGGDSTALAWLVDAVAPELAARVVGLIHVNHQLRGDESDADEAFCRALAARMSLAIDVVRVDAAALARAEKRSIESAARDARYRAFSEAATRLRATHIATGHTLDDQAETVLLRLLRGTGLRGASAVRIRRGAYIRPLLECRRQDLAADLAARAEPFRDDASNRDLRIARNRLRAELMPVIERIAPGGVRALARFAALAAADERWLEHEARNWASSAIRMRGDGVEVLQADALRAMPPALARRVVRDTLDRVTAGRVPGSRHIAAVCDLAQSDQTRARADLSGATAERVGAEIIVRRVTTGRHADPVVPPFERPLPVPGDTPVPEAGVIISVAEGRGGADTVLSGHGRRVVLAAGSVTLPLTVRNRRDGDRMKPLGAPGRRKLQDLFVDRKVARHDRDRVPVVVDGTGRIVWVAGVAMADECRVTRPEAGVVILELKQPN